MNGLAALGSLMLNPYVAFSPPDGGFPIDDGARAAPILIDSADFPGVIRAGRDLQQDVERVTQRRPELQFFSGQPPSQADGAILVGTLGKSPLIDRLAREHKIDVSQVRGKWEASVVQVVADPAPGIGRALVIAGSDKRGTIFALYDISEQIGVSPWHWWADVPIRRHDSLWVRPGSHVRREPAVKYRGIFLNDEAPSLSNWVHQNFGDYNHRFYEHVFELLLRLRANYLWPAMWNSCFSEDDPLNPKLADEYGIVMGTSHVEPMMRADKEWNRAGHTADEWNFDKNPDALTRFWTEGVIRNKPYENVVTVAMRGKIDTPMSESANIALLEKIVAAQRKILAEEIDPDVAKVPQLWALYKEVQEYYEKGMRVPDDVTLLWCDDNWGNVRRLPTPEERARRGGAGIYYHFDYVGGPRNYKWIDTNPLPKIWEQMTTAYRYGADRIWIVNVGDLKPMELPMEYFLSLAWDPASQNPKSSGEFTRAWAAREFEARFAGEIADIVAQTLKLNGRRKPELLDPSTYSLANYGEADRVVGEYNALVKRAEQLSAKLPAEARDAFFQLVIHPAKAAAIVNELYVTVAKNRLYARQGRASANDLASRAEGLFRVDAELASEYHQIAGGKWNHMMDQTHIGYTGWQQPDKDVMPAVRRIAIPASAQMGIAIEGSASFWPDAAPADLPEIDSFNRQSRYVDVFNRGSVPFHFSAKSNEPWLRITPAEGVVEKETRLSISADWRRAPRERTRASVHVEQEGQGGVDVAVSVFNPRLSSRVDGFVESGGCVAIEAGHYSSNVPGAAKWVEIPGYGRTESGMTIDPVDAPSCDPSHLAGPCLEYKMYLFDAGKLNVEGLFGPSLAFQPGRGLRVGISFDDERPQIVDIAPAYLSHAWEEAVKDNVSRSHTTHSIAAPGYHTLKVWMVDPGVVLERLVVDLGGIKPSYLGPPESYRRG